MAILVGYVSIPGQTRGLVLPVFREHALSNSDIVQNISPSGKIAAFDAILLDRSDVTHLSVDYRADLGDDSIWIYRNGDQDVEIIFYQNMEKFVQQIIKEHDQYSSVFVLWDMAKFLGVAHRELTNTVTRLAYSALAEVSSTGANVWRDVEVFLPVLRAELLRQYAAVRQIERLIFDSYILSTKDGVNVYLPTPLFDIDFDASSIRKMGELFGITSITVLPAVTSGTQGNSAKRRFILSGAGSVATQIVLNWKYRNQPTRVQGGIKYYEEIIKDQFSNETLQQAMDLSLTILSVGSEEFLRFSERFERINRTYSICLYVWSSGFGTPKKNLDSARRAARSRSSFEYIWWLFSHRARQPLSFTPNLGSLAQANRAARLAAEAIRCLYVDYPTAVVGRQTASSFGIVGVSESDRHRNAQAAIRSAITSMLIPEYPIWKAKRIFAIGSMSTLERNIPVQILDDIIIVEFLPSTSWRNKADVVIFAVDVRPSMDIGDNFTKICAITMESYGAKISALKPSGFVAEFGGQKYVVRTFHDKSINNFEFRATQKDDNDHILTIMRKNTSEVNMKVGYFRSNVITYSHIREWMRSRYRDREA